MPATYEAVSSVLDQTKKLYSKECKSLLDVGAGTGAATWAACNYFNIEKIVCLEKEAAMEKIGRKYMREGHRAIQQAEWYSQDLINMEIEEKYDMVISSYVLNEMTGSAGKTVISKLWNCADKLLVIIEPGTPKGFDVIKYAREQLLNLGAHIVAPCPHEQECRIKSDDWCHFTCRVQRSKLHKLIKNADVPYEDEKYSYIVFAKEKVDNEGVRILRHPQIAKGRIDLEICGKNENKKIRITKKNKELFKKARKVKCGDMIK